jgi:hypothetical protein
MEKDTRIWGKEEEGAELFAEENFFGDSLDLEKTFISVCVDFRRNTKMQKFLKKD